jgi:hypothetical protein
VRASLRALSWKAYSTNLNEIQRACPVDCITAEKGCTVLEIIKYFLAIVILRTKAMLAP